MKKWKFRTGLLALLLVVGTLVTGCGSKTEETVESVLKKTQEYYSNAKSLSGDMKLETFMGTFAAKFEQDEKRNFKVSLDAMGKSIETYLIKEDAGYVQYIGVMGKWIKQSLSDEASQTIMSNLNQANTVAGLDAKLFKMEKKDGDFLLSAELSGENIKNSKAFQQAMMTAGNSIGQELDQLKGKLKLSLLIDDKDFYAKALTMDMSELLAETLKSQLGDQMSGNIPAVNMIIRMENLVRDQVKPIELPAEAKNAQPANGQMSIPGLTITPGN